MGTSLEEVPSPSAANKSPGWFWVGLWSPALSCEKFLGGKKPMPLTIPSKT